MVLYSVGAIALFLFTFYSTKERIQPPKDQQTDLQKDLSELVKNKPWLSVIVMGVTTIMWIAMRDGAILCYFKYYVVGQVEEGGEFARLATWFNVIGTVGTLTGVGCTRWLTELMRGKKNARLWLTVLVTLIASLYGLRLMMSLIPSGMGLLVAALVLTYGIDRALKTKIENELSERKRSEGTLELASGT